MWLMKHPSGLPRVLKWSQRNSRSARRKTQAETSSTKPRRCVMPPAPSLPGLPFLSRWVARARRSLSSGFRRHVTTRDAKMGERGQPWLTPSSMRRVRQVQVVAKELLDRREGVVYKVPLSCGKLNCPFPLCTGELASGWMMQWHFQDLHPLDYVVVKK